MKLKNRIFYGKVDKLVETSKNQHTDKRWENQGYNLEYLNCWEAGEPEDL